MQNHTLAVDGVSYATRIAPPLTVTGASLFGLPLSEWVYITTIVYTLLQTGYFIWKLVSKEKQKLVAQVQEEKDKNAS